jgi:hypothetical protein
MATPALVLMGQGEAKAIPKRSFHVLRRLLYLDTTKQRDEVMGLTLSLRCGR